MKIYEILEKLEKEFPESDAYEWDNVGLLVGDRERDVKKVVTCLDVTEDVVRFAIDEGAGLIVAHHPVIFSPLNRINGDTKNGKLLLLAIENKIAIYAAHTNCDKAKCGINTRIAEIFGLDTVEPLEEDGLGRIGNLEKGIDFCEFAKNVEQALTTTIRYSGDTKKKVKRIAICSGAGGDCLPTAIEKGADVIITGDTKYHQMLDYAGDINIIDAGHFGTEKVVTGIFADIMSPLGVPVLKWEAQDVFKYL